LRAADYLKKGLALMWAVRKAGVTVYRGATDLGIEGEERAETFSFRQGGRNHRLSVGLVALHEGVIPNQQITRLVGAGHVWDEVQQCFRPKLDRWLMSDVEGISVAGDGGGIGGARAAEHRGRLAALGIAHRLGVLDTMDRDARAGQDRAALERELAVRPLLDALYAPPEAVLDPPDRVVVCRCEEVTAGQIRVAVAMGCPGPNQAKSYLRCGMGPCQGRLCGPTVSMIISRARREAPEDIGYYRIRPPLKPLTLGELAALEEDVPAPATE
jgi:NADPH-dependent 2,4-dienoyl-CoA reductase/sulfur reductase-like enzyme